MRSRHILLIANPAAGGHAPKKIEMAQKSLSQSVNRVDTLLTRARGDARRFARQAQEEDYDLIVACGGDGTLNEVINGMAPSPTPLAFLPLGTTNVFALEVGIPFRVEEACKVALEAKPRKICLGLAGTERFLLMAGIGFDADVLENVNLRIKKLLGKGAYVASGFMRFWRYSHPPLKICTDEGKVFSAYSAILCNVQCYGGDFKVTPQASLTSDTLEAFIVQKPGRVALAKVISCLLMRRPMNAALGQILRVRSMKISGTPAPVQLDGDFFGRLPMTFTTTFGEISLVFPNRLETLSQPNIRRG